MTMWAVTFRFPFMGETVDIGDVFDLPTDDPGEARALLAEKRMEAEIVDVRRKHGDAHLERNDAAWGAHYGRFRDEQMAIYDKIAMWQARGHS